MFLPEAKSLLITDIPQQIERNDIPNIKFVSHCMQLNGQVTLAYNGPKKIKMEMYKFYHVNFKMILL